jgi:hypothetical protein
MTDRDFEVKATVLGDCGIIHPSFEHWQECEVCGAILRSRRPIKHQGPSFSYEDWRNLYAG